MANDLRLTIVAGEGAGREVTIPETGAVLGRDKTADIVLGEKVQSRRHCRIFRQEGRWLVEDLGSRNGTFVNGTRATRAELRGGDTIQLGQTRLTVPAPVVPARPAEPEPAAAGHVHRRRLVLIACVSAAVLALAAIAYILHAMHHPEGTRDPEDHATPVLPAMPDQAKKTSSEKMPAAKDGEEPVVLPEKYKAEAEKAFAQGYTYFIWPAEPGPFQRGDSQVLVVPFLYVAKSKPVPFLPVLGVIITPQDGGEPYVKEGILKGEKPPAYGPSGKGGVICLDFFKALSGKGKGSIRLLDYETGKNQISNVITVDVEF